MKNIKHILFDLGGVLLNLDFQKSVDAFQKSGLIKMEQWVSSDDFPDFFTQFELGKISKDAFFKEINKLSEKYISDSEIVEDWNAMLLDFPLRRLQILQQLQIHYDLFLVSNTNEIHEACFNEKIKAMTGFPNINVFLDRVYYSHRIHLRKPDPEIFEKVLSENNMKPEFTLFIDDNKTNTDAAEKLGIRTIWQKKGMTIEEDIFKSK